VAVPNGAGRDAYLGALRAALPGAIERARPDVVLYQAGADPYREDPYSPLQLDASDLLERDGIVFEALRAAGIPVAWVLAGGYTRDITKVVDVHVNTARAACQAFAT
jgi:acetoin utilization deacetylase AcuC-like enzyme